MEPIGERDWADETGCVDGPTHDYVSYGGGIWRCRRNGCNAEIWEDREPVVKAAIVSEKESPDKEALVEEVAHHLYAAGPWGPLHEVDSNLRECVFSHDMKIYRSMASAMLEIVGDTQTVKRQPNKPLRWLLDQIVTVKTVQRSLPKLLQRQEPLVVTRRGEPVAVLVPINQYEGVRNDAA